ncbi:MAG TPA: methyltransferase domain-containing protein [Blastocatellia bacterium]|nr:methyltransferase domain-containing protein [Blastocatellia bacterium]
MDTRDKEYADRLIARQTVWWKKALHVQAPYRWNLRRIRPGFTLELGCGIGRNLSHLNGNGVGVDHSFYAVEAARSRGLQAFTPEEFRESAFNKPATFDSLLCSHVAEHMTDREVADLLSEYLYLLKPFGLVIIITPQEAGYRSDPTHVQFMTFNELRNIARETGLIPVREYSFPFPRLIGHLFIYNEFVSINRKPF